MKSNDFAKLKLKQAYVEESEDYLTGTVSGVVGAWAYVGASVAGSPIANLCRVNF